MSKQPEDQMANDLQKAIRDLERITPGALTVSNAVTTYQITATLILSRRVGQVAAAADRIATAAERIEKMLGEWDQ